MEQEMKTCNNCKEQIAVATFPLHERRCKDYCTYCKECQETVPKDSWETHVETYHVPVPCPDCRTPVPPAQQDAHKDVCPEGLEDCKFCQLQFKRKEISDHVGPCGSRTDQCTLCGVRVKIAEMEEHQALKCGHLRAEPALSPEVLASMPGLDYCGPSDPVTDDSALASRLQREEMERDRAFERDLNMARELQEQQYRYNPHSVFTTSGGSGFFSTYATSSYHSDTTTTTTSASRAVMDTYRLPYESLPVYHSGTGNAASSRNSDSVETDSALAARLQAEENDRDRAYEVDLNLARQLQDVEDKQPSGHGLGQHSYREFRPIPSSTQTQYNGSIAGPLYSESDHTESVEESLVQRSIKTELPQDLLPCQFCDGYFPARKLTLHQNTCSSSNGGDTQPCSSGIGHTQPCSHCGKLVPVATCSVHETACVKNPANRDDEEEILIPCEACEQLFPFDKIHTHQVSCALYGH